MSEDAWLAGDRYEPYVGRWSRPVATALVDWMAPRADARWLDVGCGTGALTSTILAAARPASVIGVDSSAGFVEHARAHVRDGRAQFHTADAMALPLADGSVDYAVCGLVLNFVADPGVAAAEMRRVCVPGGAIAAYVWDYAEGMQMIRAFFDAATALDPAAVSLDEGRRFPLCHPEALTRLFTGAGLADVRSRPIVVPTVFADFDDYWTPFLGGQGPAPGYCMSLPEPDRVRLRERLRATLAPSEDGAIHLTARAWAVSGTVNGA